MPASRADGGQEEDDDGQEEEEDAEPVAPPVATTENGLGGLSPGAMARMMGRGRAEEVGGPAIMSSLMHQSGVSAAAGLSTTTTGGGSTAISGTSGAASGSWTGDGETQALENRVRELQLALLHAEKEVASLKSTVLEKNSEIDELKERLVTVGRKAKKSVRDAEMRVRAMETRTREKEEAMETMRKRLEAVVQKEHNRRHILASNSPQGQQQRRRQRQQQQQQGNASFASSVNTSSASARSAGSARSSCRAPRPRSQHPPMELDEAVMDERERMAEEIAALRHRVRELSEMVRDAENAKVLARMHASQAQVMERANNALADDALTAGVPSGSTATGEEILRESGALEVISQLVTKTEEQKRKIAKMHQTIVTTKAQLDVQRDDQDRLAGLIEQVQEENANLKLELQVRPTVRAWRERELEVSDLETRLAEALEQGQRLKEERDLRRLAPTSELIRRDKENHRLGLGVIQDLPKQIMVDTLRQLCRQLELSDIGELGPALTKMKRVVDLVPRMEAFVADVCDFVFEQSALIDGEGYAVADSGAASVMDNRLTEAEMTREVADQPIMEDALPVLHKWWELLQSLASVKDFAHEVKVLTQRRHVVLHQANPTATVTMTGSLSSPDADAKLIREEDMPHSPRQIMQSLQNMVEFELTCLQRKETLQQAAQYVKDNPQTVANRLLTHLCYLFDVRDLEGLLPHMNTVYLFVNQMRNFLRTSRVSLGLPDSANDDVLISFIDHVLREYAAAEGVDAASKALGVQHKPQQQPSSAATRRAKGRGSASGGEVDQKLAL